MTEPADSILTRLAEISRAIEEHRAVIYRLEVERLEQQLRLRASGWKPPSTGGGPPSTEASS